MRPLGNDRSRFPSNPPEVTRKLERQTDNDVTIRTVRISGFTYEVVGIVSDRDGVTEPVYRTYILDISPTQRGYFL